MAKKEKKISINAFEEVVKERFPSIITERWYDVDVTMKYTLSLAEMIAFVREAADACFLEDGTYAPEIFDFAIKSGVLTYYANFSLPENIEKQYWLICGSDAVDFVLQHINHEQYSEIVGAVMKEVRHRLDTDTFATRAKLNELIATFSKLSDKMSEVFDGVGADDVQKVLTAVGVSGIDERKIVDAYVEHIRDGSIGGRDE